jgi:hypothetical protein
VPRRGRRRRVVGGAESAGSRPPSGPAAGAFRRRRVVEIDGPESSGRRTPALHCVAEAQKKGGFIDAEPALDPVCAGEFGERLADRATALRDGRRGGTGTCALGGDLVLGGGRLAVFEPWLHLLDRLRAAFGAAAIPFAAEFGDLEPEVCDHRLGGGVGHGQRHHAKRSCPRRTSRSDWVAPLTRPSPGAASSAARAGRSLRGDDRVGPPRSPRRSCPSPPAAGRSRTARARISSRCSAEETVLVLFCADTRHPVARNELTPVSGPLIRPWER